MQRFIFTITIDQVDLDLTEISLPVSRHVPPHPAATLEFLNLKMIFLFFIFFIMQKPVAFIVQETTCAKTYVSIHGNLLGS